MSPVRRRSLVATTAVLLGLGLTACGGSDDDGDGAPEGAAAGATSAAAADAPASKADPDQPPIHFALTASKTHGGDLLTGLKAGAEVAAAKINAEGGFGGREAVVDSCNGMMQPAGTVVCARKALAKKPVAGFGCDLSWSVGGLPVFAKAEIPTFNCPNTKEDLTNPTSFGLTPGSDGGRRGNARWLCTRPEVKRVVLLTYDTPQERAGGRAALAPILEGCGKQIEAVYFPLAGGDLTPYVARTLKAKPDFIIMSGSGPTALGLLKGFAQNDVPASKISMPAQNLGWENLLEQAGSLADGVYSLGHFSSWGDTDDPDVAEYLAAMERFSDEDPRDPNTQWGYLYMMYFHAAAEKIGFDRFDSATLTEFSQKTNGFPIPMSRSLVNPGPEGHPQQKQPYVRIEQYQGDGTFKPVAGGDGGWFDGF